MSRKLYSPTDYGKFFAHHGAAALLAAGVAFAAPAFSAVALVRNLIAEKIRKKSSDDILGLLLVKHPHSLPEAPRLGEIVREIVNEIHGKSGLKSEDSAVYGLRETPLPAEDAEESTYKNLEKFRFEITGTPQAFSVLYKGRPLIFVTRPLLRLLNPEETKAVLAHEFTHATARHNTTQSCLDYTTDTPATAGWLVVLFTALLSGFSACIGAAAASLAGMAAAYKAYPSASRTPGSGTRSALSRQHDESGRLLFSSAFGAAASVGYITAFNPAFPAVVAGVAAITVCGKFLRASFSRACEYQADRGAVTLGADPLALITALRKLSTVAKRSEQETWRHDVPGSSGPPQTGFLTSAWIRATASHPSLSERARHLAALARAEGYDEEDIANALNAPLRIPEEHNIPHDVVRLTFYGIDPAQSAAPR